MIALLISGRFYATFECEKNSWPFNFWLVLTGRLVIFGILGYAIYKELKIEEQEDLEESQELKKD